MTAVPKVLVVDDDPLALGLTELALSPLAADVATEEEFFKRQAPWRRLPHG